MKNKKNPGAIWHPFTQHALFPEAVKIDYAKGAYLYTDKGARIIDAISSWWVNTHGHNHPAIVKAVQAQAEKLDQVIFAGFTHAPAEELAEKLLHITDKAFSRVFYSDSGSTAVEVALKMALGYWVHRGQPRKGIVVMEQGYHGDTFGAMSVGERSAFTAPYNDFLFNVHRLPFPHAGQEHKTLETFEKIIKAHHKDIAALILEPLVSGAGGMLMYSADTLKSLHDLCRAHDILLIADEVMTGWGRTGKMFACQHAGIMPDIMCLSKGLTGGFLPLAATLCTEKIYQAYYSTDRAKTFFHSSSYTGNPLACAAACANMKLWEEEPVQDRINTITAHHARALKKLGSRPDTRNIRQTGTIAAFDIPVEKQGYLSDLGPQLYRFFMARGLLLRPLGNTVYILPPYCISKEDLDDVYAGIEHALDALRHGELEQAA